ncbi:glycosyl transferase [Fischerella thermalis CCMEE 5198]|jgi:ceramide glucosyltransferase|uniref:glycosyltransferase n=1 Tax=Fischerella thermalis TaxID=372787 RepID=UPI000C7FBB58|nr:glycosyltransferase [Fischerella thermalis]PMB01326.1 glycosyl transferase [Fischerella thermalis CCMEE 5196]PMB27712.1 glycosyl transferase [Fischerella thermalis CCMEE 5198]PMB50188.1 glycosyl transferase [Fischerella thermalis CCMEE 5201]
MIIILEIIFLTLMLGSVVFYIACAIFTHQFFASTQQQIPSNQDVPVSIMVSVSGLDEGAWENWSSLCKQNYPNYEVLFGVTDPKDSAVPLLKRLVATFPEQVRLFIGLEPRGVNYKDSNLSYLLEQSQHEVIIFADGDIRVNPDYIRTLVSPLLNGTADVVTSAYIGYNPQYLGAAVASFGRCVDFIPSLLIARRLDDGLRLTIGVTIATRKTTLADFGGLHLNRIGSDYNLGKRAAQAGYKVELSPHILEWDTGRENLKQVFTRELRWARTIRYNRGAQYYTMVFCYGTVYCIPLLLLSGFAGWAVAICLTTIIIRYMQVLVSIFSMNCPKLLRWLWIIPLRDSLSFIVWVMGAFGQRIYWRGRYLRVEGDGVISPWK